MFALDLLGRRSRPGRVRSKPKRRPGLEALESRTVLSTITSVTAAIPRTVYGQPDSFTAQVQGDGTGTPSGTLQFYVDGVASGLPAVINAQSGGASLSESAFPVGSHSVSAMFFSGGTTFESSGTVVVPVIGVTTRTSVAAAATRGTYGQIDALTATVVSNAPGLATPAGSVQFAINGNPFGAPVGLDGNGRGTLNVPLTSVGNEQVTASFTPLNPDFVAGDSMASPLALSVAPAPLQVFAQGPASVTYGSQAPPLRVSYGGFVNGDTASSLTTPAAAWTAAGPASPAGSYPIVAGGASDPNYAISYLPGTLTVTPAATTTAVNASATLAGYGQAETFTARVSAVAPSTGLATGRVQFVVDGQAAGSPLALVAGQASFTTSGLTVGPHAVAAVYLPDANTLASDDRAAPATVTVLPMATAVTFGGSTTVSARSTTLDAVVSPLALTQATNPGQATGTVTFMDVTGGKTTVLGTAPVALAQGLQQASLTLNAGATLTPGTHWFVASYSGDANDAASTSAPFSMAIRNDTTLVDLNGDGKADLSVFGPIGSTGKYGFQTLTSSSGLNSASAVVFDNYGYGFGNKSSIPVSADYFGEGKAAYALWTPNASGGMTFTAVSSVNPGESLTVNFGGTNDVPVIADVDGDGKADFGVYGYAPGLGYRFDFLTSSSHFNVTQQSIFNNYGYGYGNSQSIPVVADFDGSGRAGFGLYNPSATGSTFTYVSPSAGVSFSRTVGGPNDIPMAVNYDGDGKADLALYGPEGGGKYRYEVLTSSSGFNPARAVTFDNYGYGYGNAASIPVVADYEGDGRADFAVYTSNFAGGMIFNGQAGQTGAGVMVNFGVAGDIPLTAPSYLRARLVRGLA